jgi:pimeloyl-ACP methyl ester carboxylesterase
VQLQPWSYATRYGFTLRGQHSTPSGKPVLHVLHGNGFCSLMYQPMLSLLTAHFDLFLSDAQGHGDSDHGGNFIGWHQCADLALEAFVAHLPLFQQHRISPTTSNATKAVKVYALGHSFGGVLTALINSRADSPFSQVVLLDPVLFPPYLLNSMRILDKIGLYRKNPYAKKALNRRQQWPQRSEVEAYLTDRGMFKGWAPSALHAYIDHALHHRPDGISLKCQPSREAEIFSSFPAKLWTELAKPCSPTLLLYGDQTYPFVPKAVKRWQRINPAITAKLVPGGHCFMQQHPEQTACQLLQYWDLPSPE